MDKLAPPLARDFDGDNGERRGSWAGDFDASRRTSFANTFLELPPDDYEGKGRKSLGAMHYVPLDEEPDLMGTPPISPVVNRNSKGPASYFDATPTHSRNQSRNILPDRKRTSLDRDSDGQTSLFSTMLNKAFETMSKSGEAMDVHSKNLSEVSDQRRAAKGKSRAIDFDDDDGSTASISARPSTSGSRPTSLMEPSTSTVKAQQPKSRPASTTATGAETDEEYYLNHPFEASLVSTLDAAERKVNQFFDWLNGEDVTKRPGVDPATTGAARLA